jgi:nitroreductase
MNVQETIQVRRSVRKYSDRPVEDDKLAAVLEAGRIAPSASNAQDWRFIVVRDAETRAALPAACRNQKFVGEAPVVIVACSTNPTRKMSCGWEAAPVDLAIAVDHMTLVARALELGTCWIGAFEQDKVKAVLGVPEDVSVVTLTPLGYTDAWPEARPRKPIEEVVCYDKWS